MCHWVLYLMDTSGGFFIGMQFGAICLSGDKMLYSKYVLIIRKEEETWIL